MAGWIFIIQHFNSSPCPLTPPSPFYLLLYEERVTAAQLFYGLSGLLSPGVFCIISEKALNPLPSGEWVFKCSKEFRGIAATSVICDASHNSSSLLICLLQRVFLRCSTVVELDKRQHIFQAHRWMEKCLKKLGKRVVDVLCLYVHTYHLMSPTTISSLKFM